MKQTIRLNGKILGEMDTDKRVFISHRTQRHFFNQYNGWGASLKLLAILEHYKIEKFIIIYSWDGSISNEGQGIILPLLHPIIYFTDLINFQIYGHKYLNPCLEEDYQLILGLSHFQIYNNIQMKGGNAR